MVKVSDQSENNYNYNSSDERTAPPPNSDDTFRRIAKQDPRNGGKESKPTVTRPNLFDISKQQRKNSATRQPPSAAEEKLSEEDEYATLDNDKEESPEISIEEKEAEEGGSRSPLRYREIQPSKSTQEAASSMQQIKPKTTSAERSSSRIVPKEKTRGHDLPESPGNEMMDNAGGKPVQKLMMQSEKSEMTGSEEQIPTKSSTEEAPSTLQQLKDKDENTGDVLSPMIAGEQLKETKETKRSTTRGTKNDSTEEANNRSSTGQKGVQYQGKIENTSVQTEKGDVQYRPQGSRSATIQDLVSQLVDKVQTMSKDGLNETLVTLKHPAMLEGATVKITTFAHARGEVNISFANLSPRAKAFLDQNLSRSSLQQGMESKGIVVHQIMTTTQKDPLVTLQSQGASKQGDREEKREDRDERQRRERAQEIEEDEQ